MCSRKKREKERAVKLCEHINFVIGERPFYDYSFKLLTSLSVEWEFNLVFILCDLLIRIHWFLWSRFITIVFSSTQPWCTYWWICKMTSSCLRHHVIMHVFRRTTARWWSHALMHPTSRTWPCATAHECSQTHMQATSQYVTTLGIICARRLFPIFWRTKVTAT